MTEATESHGKNGIFQLIRETLLEDETDETYGDMAHSAFKLQAAEKSFYEALYQSDPSTSSTSPSIPTADSRFLLPHENLISTDFSNKKRVKKRNAHTGKEGRAKKQLAVYAEDGEDDADDFSELFERLFLSPDEENQPVGYDGQKSIKPALVRGREMQRNGEEIVDLRSLLISCAQTMASDQYEFVGDLLKQIRKHSSPMSNASHRVAHYFANGLEARLMGPPRAEEIWKLSATEMLNAYKLFQSACPFRKITSHFTNHHILNVAQRAPTLHIIDFGILYGFQWPSIIQQLSSKTDGPPKLRITGIEFPQPDLRPTDLVDQAGRRIAKYCKRFNVPFEYSGIAQKWETIKLKDLKIDKGNEAIAVTCMFRLEKLFEETIEMERSPRAVVLNLIREINPDIFVHGIFNASYNCPTFFGRFKEALSYYCAFFEMFEDVIAQKSEEWRVFEREVLGKEVMNVIACEGAGRVVRPESYKQWQLRNQRAGFRKLLLEKVLIEVARARLGGYSKNLLLCDDEGWLLQGWKGRVLSAISCWASAKDLKNHKNV